MDFKITWQKCFYVYRDIVLEYHSDVLTTYIYVWDEINQQSLHMLLERLKGLSIFTTVHS